jgi:hypothetical protein
MRSSRRSSIESTDSNLSHKKSGTTLAERRLSQLPPGSVPDEEAEMGVIYRCIGLNDIITLQSFLLRDDLQINLLGMRD